MLSSLSWLGLETKALSQVQSFYGEQLGLSQADRTRDWLVYCCGDHRLVFRLPSGLPRGGVHTHFAISTNEYDTWFARLSDSYDIVEHRFGEARSLYCYDPDGNCVEIGEADDVDTALGGIFEVVLEVSDLDRAESFYRALGFRPVDRGSDRQRIRLAGPVDLELWEPHLGIANARGGLHVELGFEVAAVKPVIEAVGERTRSVTTIDHVDGIGTFDEAIRVIDPDGHVLSFV